jgi:HlyD family secretion protein
MINLLKRFIPITIILIVVLASSYYLLWGIGGGGDALTVSGTVEVVEMVVGIDAFGQVAEVIVSDGDHVNTGEVLVRFEDEVLQAQYEQANADLNKALADFELIAAQPLEESRKVGMADAQLELLNAEQALQELMDHSKLVRAHALQVVDESEQALEDLLVSNVMRTAALEKIAIAERSVDQAEKYLKIVSSPPPQSAIDQAYANMLMAEKKLNNTLEAIEDIEWQITKVSAIRVPGEASDQIRRNVKEMRSQAMKALRQAHEGLELKRTRDQLAYNQAETKYNNLLEPPDATEIAVAEAGYLVAQAALAQAQREYARVKDGPSDADIAVLQAKIDLAKREYRALEEGPDPDDLALAEARLQLADAKLDLAQADNTLKEQLAVASLQIEDTEAALRVIQIQLGKLVLTAPVNGTVISHFIEVGEMVEPGRPAFKIADLDHLTITVYLPEVQRHKIQIGDQAVVVPNSFPNQLFRAEVTRIADQGDFTPSNIRIRDNDQPNVFGVKLVIDNPTGMLKPGMTVDVVFQE